MITIVLTSPQTRKVDVATSGNFVSLAFRAKQGTQNRNFAWDETLSLAKFAIKILYQPKVYFLLSF